MMKRFLLLLLLILVGQVGMQSPASFGLPANGAAPDFLASQSNLSDVDTSTTNTVTASESMTAQTVAAHAIGVLNVLDWVAKGNGGDDSAAINAAIASVPDNIVFRNNLMIQALDGCSATKRGGSLHLLNESGH